MNDQIKPAPRPKLNDEMKLNAARKLVADMIKNGELEIEGADPEHYAQDIAKRGRQWMDGYELARDLERYHHWDCNLTIADALDNFSHYAELEVSASEKEWARVNEIKPPLPLGTRVSINTGENGTLDEIYKHGTARYCVKLDDDPRAAAPTNSRRIVKFEDVTELPRSPNAGDQSVAPPSPPSPEPNLTEPTR